MMALGAFTLINNYLAFLCAITLKHYFRGVPDHVNY